MPKFIITASIEVEADTQEEARTIADTFLLGRAVWNIDYCEQVDDDDDDDCEDDDDDDCEDDDDEELNPSK
jgi:hypothetical protein